MKKTEAFDEKYQTEEKETQSCKREDIPGTDAEKDKY